MNEPDKPKKTIKNGAVIRTTIEEISEEELQQRRVLRATITEIFVSKDRERRRLKDECEGLYWAVRNIIEGRELNNGLHHYGITAYFQDDRPEDSILGRYAYCHMMEKELDIEVRHLEDIYLYVTGTDVEDWDLRKQPRLNHFLKNIKRSWNQREQDADSDAS